MGEIRVDAGARQMTATVRLKADTTPTTATAVPRTIVFAKDDPAAPTTVRLRSVVLWLAGWTGFVVVMAGVITTQRQVPFRYTVLSEAVNCYTLAAASLVVWLASARMSALGWPQRPQVVVHVALGTVLIAAWQLTHFGYLRMMMGPMVWDRMYRDTWLFQLVNAIVLYGAVVGGTLAIHSARRARLQEQRQHALALAAREAELRALNAQLEPHFILNTLNSVLALIDGSPREARLMIERLSELLKAAFDEMEEPDVPLGRELDLIDAYLGIEQIRFGDRLRVTIDAPDAARAIPVPPFLLQPIVENAIKHGVAPLRGPAFVTIAARLEHDRLCVRVIDSGRGFDHTSGSRSGRGLHLAERRLKAFAPDAELRVERGHAGFAVVLTLPA
jgi:two-component system LytT family sensor kinase